MTSSNEQHDRTRYRYNLLKDRARSFCDAFLALPNNPPEKILDQHFRQFNAKITEHGPSWATKRLPFLGKTFAGRDECLKYFDLLGKTLEFMPQQDTFPGSDGFIVDPDANIGEGHGAVSVVGQAKFKAVATGESWSEQFIYRLSEFSEEGKIGHWEIWADPLSAWEAVRGGKVG